MITLSEEDFFLLKKLVSLLILLINSFTVDLDVYLLMLADVEVLGVICIIALGCVHESSCFIIPRRVGHFHF